MAETSSIEWTDATWNPITGCSVVSPGCTNCYAMKLAGTRLKHTASRQGLTTDSKAGPVWNGKVRLNESMLLDPLRWRKPLRIFVCAHGDLFHESVPDEWIDKVFAVMALAQHHTFQVLTKRPARMRTYFAGIPEIPDEPAARDALIEGEAQALHHRRTGKDPSLWLAVHMPLPNVWLGISAEDQARADERIPDLLETPAAVRFVSAEPLLGPIDLRHVQAPRYVPEDHDEDWKFDALAAGSSYDFKSDLNYWADGDGPVREAALDWIIVGGESGPGARPMHPDWPRQIRDDCAAASVPFFFKQWGAWKDGSDFASDASVVLTDGRVLPFDLETLKAADRDAPVPPGNPTLMRRVGKKAAGRRLDGVEHNAMPAAG